MPRLDKSLGRVTQADRDPVGENFGDFFQTTLLTNS